MLYWSIRGTIHWEDTKILNLHALMIMHLYMNLHESMSSVLFKKQSHVKMPTSSNTAVMANFNIPQLWIGK